MQDVYTKERKEYLRSIQFGENPAILHKLAWYAMMFIFFALLAMI